MKSKRITTDKKRICLKCNKLFDSNGPHNRICDNCEKINVKIFNKERVTLGSNPDERYN